MASERVMDAGDMRVILFVMATWSFAILVCLAGIAKSVHEKLDEILKELRAGGGGLDNGK